MANIAPDVVVLTDVLLTIGLDNYEASVSQVELTPATSTVVWKGMKSSAVYTLPTATTWTATLAYAQDWDNEDSLSNYLFDNEGETVEMTFTPKNGGQAWKANIVITPGAIGGTVDTVAVGTVTLGVTGRPQKVTGA